MANELHEKGSTIPTQDIPVDDAETQPLQVNIQVPQTVNAERSNSGKYRFFRYIFTLFSDVMLKSYVLIFFILFLCVVLKDACLSVRMCAYYWNRVKF